MSVTARSFVITDDEIANAGGGSYATLEVPADYPAVLESVEDYEKTEKRTAPGWVLKFRIEGLPFQYWISHSDASRWKLIEMVEAFAPGFFETRADDGTTQPINPGGWVGQTVGAHVILDDSSGTPRKSIDSIFAIVAEEDEPQVADVPEVL